LIQAVKRNIERFPKDFMFQLSPLQFENLKSHFVISKRGRGAPCEPRSNEAAWSSLYSTKSRPFDPPTKGKIAIKVINHYGDEVLKVYEI
jgi:hypothetical protein